jgi:hypothetical protein
MPDMINPQKGIDLMNNTSIINRILFAVIIFQHQPRATSEKSKGNNSEKRKIASQSGKYGF